MTDNQSQTGMRVLIIGIVVLVVGIILAAIPVTQQECVTVIYEICATVTTFPYAPYGGVLFLIGIIMIIIGGVMMAMARQPTTPGTQQPYYGQSYQQGAPQQYAQNPGNQYPQQYSQQYSQYPANPNPQQQPTPVGTCGYCARPYYSGETVCQGCGYALQVDQQPIPVESQ